MWHGKSMDRYLTRPRRYQFVIKSSVSAVSLIASGYIRVQSEAAMLVNPAGRPVGLAGPGTHTANRACPPSIGAAVLGVAVQPPLWGCTVKNWRGMPMRRPGFLNAVGESRFAAIVDRHKPFGRTGRDDADAEARATS